MRSEALDSYSHKFCDPFAAWLYAASADDEIGSVDEGGWFGRYGRHVLIEDSQGFVSRDRLAARTFEALVDFVAAP